MSKHKFEDLVNKLTILEETEKGQLQGGFSSISSQAYSLAKPNEKCVILNLNCQGGNCTAGCGSTN